MECQCLQVYGKQLTIRAYRRRRWTGGWLSGEGENVECIGRRLAGGIGDRWRGELNGWGGAGGFYDMAQPTQIPLSV